MSDPDQASRISRRADAAALGIATLFPAVATWVYFVLLSQHPSTAVHTAYSVEKLLQFAFPAVWLLLIRRQKLQWAKPSMAGLGEGLALGIIVLSGTLLLYFYWLKPAEYLVLAVGPMAAKAKEFGMDSPSRWILGGVLLSLINSLLEEYYWRWFLFGGMRRFMPVAAAVILSSVAFAAHHAILLAVFFGGSPLPTIFFSLCVAVGGAAWAWIYQRSGSLLGPWLSHILIDAGIFIVGYDLIWSH